MELISREACKDLMISKYRGNPTISIGKVLVTIDQVRTIESRPKGKWRTSRVHGGIVKCDFCGFQWGSNEGRKFNYCPNCGADMRGEEK